MRRKPKGPADASLAPVPSEILDQFVGQGPMSPAALDAAVWRFKNAIIERALGGELTHHLGYPPGGAKPDDTSNYRNGTGGKTVITDDGPLPIEVLRDREGSFEPRLIATHERRFTGFDDKLLALYASGMTVREIQAFLVEMYAVEGSPDLMSTVTDAVMDEVAAWQTRPLEPMYPVFFDALRINSRRGHGTEESDLSGPRRPARWLARHPRALDRADRGREVLDESVQRSEVAGVPRPF